MTLREYLEGCYPKEKGGAKLYDYAFREVVITQESFEISDLTPEEKRGVHKLDLQKKPFLQQHGVARLGFLILNRKEFTSSTLSITSIVLMAVVKRPRGKNVTSFCPISKRKAG